jgi:hypothetical protein
MSCIDALKLLNLTTPEAKTEGSDESKTYAPGKFPDPSEYFQMFDGGEFEVWAPTKGAHTANTPRTRTELRETTEKNTQFNWKYTDFKDHWLKVASTVKQVPKSGEVVIGQIHVKNSTRPPVKLSMDKVKNGIGQLTVGFREKYNQEDPKDYILIKNVPVGTRVAWNIHANESGAVLFSASFTDGYGKKQVGNITLQFDKSWATKSLYFKAGAYNQDDPKPDTLPTEGSRVRFHKLEILHV